MATQAQVVKGASDYFGASSEGAPNLAVITMAAQSAIDAINEIRDYRTIDTEEVIETRYLNLAIRIAVYLCEKQGVDGAMSFSENGIMRSFETGDIPPSMLGQVTPICRGW